MRLRFRGLVQALIAAAGVATCLTGWAGSFTSTFNDPNQSGFTLNGTGTLADGTSWMPILGNGSLLLTTNVNSIGASFILDDLDSGQNIESFTAKFKLQLGPGSGNPADGFFFGFSPDISSGSTFGEEGPAMADGGLGVEFDTYDNGIAIPDTIGIDIMAGTSTGPFGGTGNNEIAVHPMPQASLVTSAPQDVVIQLSRNGTLNVSYAGKVIYTNQYVYGWFPVHGQFGFGARTGGENDVMAISNLSITTVVAGTGTASTISAQPQNVSINEGQTATFSVGYDGSAPLNFQWSKNGTPIPLSTNAPLTTPDVIAAQQQGLTYSAYGPFNVLTLTNETPADNNAKFTLTISSTNAAGTVSSVTSQPATLTVKADTTAPTLVSAVASNDFQHVVLVFSKPVTQATAEAIANYQINGLAVSAASLSTNDNRTVILTTAAMAYNSPYTLTVSNVKDTSFTGNSIAANSTLAFTSPALNLISAGAIGETNGTTFDLGLTFSLPVDPASATSAANYHLSAGTVTQVILFTNSPGVVLQATGLTVGSNYTVTVSNVANLVGNKMTATNMSFAVSPLKWGEVGADQLGLGFPSGYAVVPVGTNGFDVYSDGFTEWNNYDESTFVYEAITGDFDKKVRVEYQDLSSQWARAGLIAREVLNFGVDAIAQTGDSGGASSNSGTEPFTGVATRYQKIHVNPVGPTLTGPGNQGNASWEGNRRLDTGGPSSSALTGPNSIPQYPNAWCRLQRTGQTFTIYRSDDGVTWINLGSTTWPDTNNAASTPMPNTVFVGPDYSPENGNITDTTSQGRFVAKFRDYGDTAASTGTATISVARTASGITLTFTGTLQSASAVTGPWTDVAGASPQTIATAGTGSKFFRSR